MENRRERSTPSKNQRVPQFRTHKKTHPFFSSSFTSPRRAALAGLAATLLARPALAAIGVWDGKSPALGSCAIGPDGDACRVRTLE